MADTEDKVTMATSSKAEVSLKLLIDTKAKRVLFAEAGKDFVDFLFNILQLPVGTVVSYLTEQDMVGTFRNLYQSIMNMNETYFQTNQTKDTLLKPKAPFSAFQIPLLSIEGGTSLAKTYYACPTNRYRAHPYRVHPYVTQTNYYHPYIADDSRAQCPSCNSKMSDAINFVTVATTEVGAAGDRGGFVKGVGTYMVMDDLVVTPMSAISSITILKKFNVKDVGALEERVVDLGMPERLKLLKASFHTKKVLTSVFFGNTED